jgi:hypothetical protein
MYKKLEIDWHPKGYHGSFHLNCIDICIAASAGYFCSDYYYYYCLYWWVYIYWNYETKNYSKSILNKLGLSIEYIEPVDGTDLLCLIKKSIDEQRPIIMLPSYTALFYCETYLMEFDDYLDQPHAIIISGYDTERPVILIRESMLLEFSNLDEFKKFIKPVISGAPFMKLQITDNMLCDIWSKSRVKTIIVLSKTHDGIIKNINDILCDIISNNFEKKSNILEIVIEYNKNLTERDYNVYYRRALANSAWIIFDIIEKYYQIDSLAKEPKEQYYSIKADYIKMRDKVLTRLHYLSKKGSIISPDEKNKLKQKVHQQDVRLLGFFSFLTVNQVSMKSLDI